VIGVMVLLVLWMRTSILSSLCTLCENQSQEAPYETVPWRCWNCVLYRPLLIAQPIALLNWLSIMAYAPPILSELMSEDIPSPSSSAAASREFHPTTLHRHRAGWLALYISMLGLLRMGLQCCHCHLQLCPLQTFHQPSWICSCKLKWHIWLCGQVAFCIAVVVRRNEFWTPCMLWSRRTPPLLLWLHCRWQFICPRESYERGGEGWLQILLSLQSYALRRDWIGDN